MKFHVGGAVSPSDRVRCGPRRRVNPWPDTVPRVLPLICLDVDGTLVGRSGVPSGQLWTAAERARKRGQRLTLCTARLAAGPTGEWARRLDPDGWHVFHTGAARWNPSSGEVRTLGLPDGALERCRDIALEHDWVFEVYTWNDYVVDDDRQLAIDHAGLLDLPFRRRPLDDLDGEVVRVQFVVPIADIDTAIAAAPPGLTVSGATSPMMPDAAFVSVTSGEATKAAGVRAVASDLGVDLAEVMMVGDGHNDLSAIDAVGWGVAMGNADPDVKAAARLLVAHVDDHGAAEAIERSATLTGRFPADR